MGAIDWKQWGKITDWLEKRKLVGDIQGAMYYISYEHEKELFTALFGEQPEGKSLVSLLGEAMRRKSNG